MNLVHETLYRSTTMSTRAWRVGGAFVATMIVATAAFAGGPIINPDNGHYYATIDNGSGLTFDEQVALAEGETFMGVSGHLVTVNNSEEAAFLEGNFPIGTVRYYVGGTDEGSEGQWYWITGEPWGFEQWGPGEPNGGTSENCIEYQPVGVAQWNDITCDGSVPDVLIEFEPQGVPTMPMGALAGLLALMMFGSWLVVRRTAKQRS